MSKKKMRAFAGAMAVVLAFVPFLSGCAANDAEDNPQAQQELNADEQSRNEAEGSIGETVQYGQVMAMNGSTATVVVGTLANANDGSGSQAFNAGQDEITFDEGDVSIVDESGAELEGRTLSADDVIVMHGIGHRLQAHDHRDPRRCRRGNECRRCSRSPGRQVARRRRAAGRYRAMENVGAPLPPSSSSL